MSGTDPTRARGLARATRRLEAGDPRLATDRVRLAYDDRHRRRLVVRTLAGERVLLDLPEAVRLLGGDRLLLDDGRVLAVEAEKEPVAELFSADPVRLAWHLGNRHTPTEILADRLRIRRDHVLEAMAARLGARIEHTETAFDPEAGAYHDGHGGGHGH
jgi:urease accessory protein